jgi:hypothetical protein
MQKFPSIIAKLREKVSSYRHIYRRKHSYTNEHLIHIRISYPYKNISKKLDQLDLEIYEVNQSVSPLSIRRCLSLKE